MLFAADAELTPILRLGAGATAGIIAMSATYPMDMVRGRLTVQVGFKILLNCEMRTLTLSNDCKTMSCKITGNLGLIFGIRSNDELKISGSY